MPTLSPLATLAAVLAEVQQQAQQHQQLLSKNEAATRAALIDPVLRALGWDTANVNLVLPEYAVSNKQKPDYFLKRKNGGTHIVIEAKKLGEDLDKLGHTGKLIGYAFTLKPAYHFVTDGLQWHCYSPSHSQYEPYMRIALSTGSLLLAALQLLQLLDAAHSGHGLPTEPGTHYVAATPHPMPEQPPTPVLPTSGITPSASIKNSVKSWLPLRTELAIPGSSPGKPTWLRLPDGSEHPLKTWKDILVNAAELTLQSQETLGVPLPDKAGKKITLLSWNKPNKERSFKQLTYHGKNVFLDTNYNAQSCVANALYLLQLLPKSKRLVEPAVAFVT